MNHRIGGNTILYSNSQKIVFMAYRDSAGMLENLPIDIARSKAKKYIAIVALYGHIDLLPVCMTCFGHVLNVKDMKDLKALHAVLLKRRRLTSFILRIVSRLLLRPFGIRAIGMQVS